MFLKSNSRLPCSLNCFSKRVSHKDFFTFKISRPRILCKNGSKFASSTNRQDCNGSFRYFSLSCHDPRTSKSKAESIVSLQNLSTKSTCRLRKNPAFVLRASIQTNSNRISPIQRPHYITSSYTYQFFEKSYSCIVFRVKDC